VITPCPADWSHMKPDPEPNEQFEWDMTAISLLALFVVLVLGLISAFGPFDHAT